MRTFTLMLDEGGEAPRTIEFRSHDTGAALSLLERENATKAELWENDTRLGTIVRNEGDFWQISA